MQQNEQHTTKKNGENVMANVKGTQITTGLRVNPKRKENSNAPALYTWMIKCDSDGNSKKGKDAFVEVNSGAFWVRLGDACPENKKSEGYELIETLLLAIEHKWLSIKGNLEAEAVYEALEAVGPPPSGSVDPFGSTPPQQEDPNELPFKECP
jgi:hypothetical protein